MTIAVFDTKKSHDVFEIKVNFSVKSNSIYAICINHPLLSYYIKLKSETSI